MMDFDSIFKKNNTLDLVFNKWNSDFKQISNLFDSVTRQFGPYKTSIEAFAEELEKSEKMVDSLGIKLPANSFKFEDINNFFIKNFRQDIFTINEINGIMEPIWDAHTQLKSSYIFSSNYSLRLINEANDELKNFADNLVVSKNFIDKLPILDDSWGKIFNFNDTKEKVKNSIYNYISNINYRIYEIEKVISLTNYDSALFEQIQQNISYDIEKQSFRIYDDFKKIIDVITNLDSFLDFPLYYFDTATEFLNSYSKKDFILFTENNDLKNNDLFFNDIISKNEEIDEEIENGLYQIDPSLVPLYKGACETINSENSDKSRHLLISLRELWSNLIRKMAPNECIEKIKQKEGSTFENKRPTRRERLSYICKEINNDQFKTFSENFIDSSTNFIESLNKVHKKNLEFTKLEMKMILSESERLIKFIFLIDYEKKEKNN